MITPQNLQKIEERLYSELPIIGGGLRRQAVQSLAQDGSPDAIRVLANAIARSTDRQVLAISSDTLRQIKKQQCIDEVCAVWSVTRHKDLTNLLVKKGWVAYKPANVKVLSALKAGQVEVVTEGRAEIVEPLLKALSDVDGEIASRASQCAVALKNLEAQELLCRLVIEKDHQIASQIAINAQYAPRDSNQRALFLFLTEQWDKYESLDFEQTLLQAAYLVGNEQLRQRIAQKVRQAGRVEWVQVLAGGLNRLRLGEMTDTEWETTLAVLSQSRDWQEMWRLAQIAPPLWSVRLLQQLKDTGWVPKIEIAELMHMGRKCIVDVLDKSNSLWRCRARLKDWYRTDCNLVISPDSKLLVLTNSAGHELRSLPDGKLLQTLSDQYANRNCLAISPNGKLLASGHQDGKAKLWSLPDGKLLQTLERMNGTICCLAISSDSKLLAIGNDSSEIRLCSLLDGKPLQTLIRDNNISCRVYLAISPDSKLLASNNGDHTIRLWSLPDGKPLQTLTGHKDRVRCLAISPNGKLLASGSDDLTVRLWSLPDGKPIQTLIGHKNINHLAISPDGKLLTDGIKLWSLPGGKLLQSLTEPDVYLSVQALARISCLTISPDSNLLGSCDSKSKIHLWSLPDGTPVQTLRVNGDTVRPIYIAISPDGKLLVSLNREFGGGGRVTLWTSGLRLLSRLPVEQISAQDMKWVQDALQEEAISEAERNWLEFIQVLVDWRRRFDIEVEEAPQRTDAGEFDIELEG